MRLRSAGFGWSICYLRAFGVAVRLNWGSYVFGVFDVNLNWQFRWISFTTQFFILVGCKMDLMLSKSDEPLIYDIFADVTPFCRFSLCLSLYSPRYSEDFLLPLGSNILVDAYSITSCLSLLHSSSFEIIYFCY